MFDREQPRRPPRARARPELEDQLEADPRALPQETVAPERPRAPRPRALPRETVAPERPRAPRPPAAPTRPSSTGAALAAQLRKREALRRAVLLQEILGPPVSLREERE